MSNNYLKILLCALTLFVLALLAGCGTPETEQPVATPQEPAAPVIDYNEMVFIPAGKCLIGGPFEEAVTKTSSPIHEVDLKAFWIDKYEVTFEQFMQFVAESGHNTKGDWRKYFDENKSMLPVFNVIYDDAVAYAKWAKKRIPTQEEWEKAAAWDDAAKQQRRWPWGNEWKDGQSNCGTRTLQNIGESKGDISFYGVHDMLGNIYEWTASTYDAYPGSKAKDKNYGIKLYVVKGASIYLEGKLYHLAARAAFPSNTILGMGFRCVRDATPDEEAKYKDMYKQ